MQPDSLSSDARIVSVAEQIGRFGDEMTLTVDRAFGSDWAENEEILALVEMSVAHATTTRRIAEVSGLNRRAVSRLIARLTAAGLVEIGASPEDGRQVRVDLTARGQRAAAQLRTDLDAFFRASRGSAQSIVVGLGRSVLPSIAPADPDPLILLRRIVSVGVALVDAVDTRAGRARLSGRQRTALIQISAHNGVRPGSLSSSLGVSRSGVAYVVDQLCEMGLVRRLPGAVPGDRRAVVLEVTPRGRELATLVEHAIRDVGEPLTSLFAAVAAWRDEAAAPIPDAAS